MTELQGAAARHVRIIKLNKETGNITSFFSFKFLPLKFITKGLRTMPLSHHDQMTLLKDILSNHQTDCCGSVSECEQLERLVKSLMVNSSINENIKPVLEQVYSYSQNGRNTQHLDNHIQSHQENLSQWVEEMNFYS